MFGLPPLAVKAIGFLLLVLVAAGAVGTFVMHERAIGATAEKERQHQVDQAFIDKLTADLAGLKAKHDPIAHELEHTKASNAAKQLEIARLSAANDHRGCLDSAAVDRLRQLDSNQPSDQNGAAARRRPDTSRLRR